MRMGRSVTARLLPLIVPALIVGRSSGWVLGVARLVMWVVRAFFVWGRVYGTAWHIVFVFWVGYV